MALAPAVETPTHTDAYLAMSAAGASAATPAPFPTPVGTLIGRRHELAAVEALLQTPGARLVTLLGPGGIGKTRLALAVAERRWAQAAFSVRVLPLDRFPSKKQAMAAVRLALDHPTPVGAGPVVAASTIGGHQDQPQLGLLLVLDGLDIVLPAPRLLAMLAHPRDGLQLLVTSRVRLGLQHELPYWVPPLIGTGSSEAAATEYVLAQAPAVQLFVARTRRVLQSFTLSSGTAHAVAEICERLDNVPLAIEHAAEAINALSIGELLERLRAGGEVGGYSNAYVPARQRSMWDSAEWSAARLSSEVREVLGRLAVFEGSFSLRGAVSVLGGVGMRGEVVRSSVPFLVDEGLLVRAQGLEDVPRFRMLAPTRGYALGLLSVTEVGALRESHARCYANLAEEAEGGLLRQEASAAALLAAERQNLHAALRWAVAAGDARAAVRLAGSLRRWWRLRTAQAPDDVSPTDLAHVAEHEREAMLRTRGGLGAATLALLHGDTPEARRLFTSAYEEAARLGDPLLVAEARGEIGIALLQLGEAEEATAHLEASRALFRELGDARGESAAVRALGRAALVGKDLSGARVHFRAALDQVGDAGDALGVAEALLGLGVCSLCAGELDAAERELGEAEMLLREVGDEVLLSEVLAALGLLRLERGSGHRRSARALLVTALLTARRAARPSALAFALECLGALAAESGLALEAIHLSACAEVLAAGKPSSFAVPCLSIVRPRLASALAQLGESAASTARAVGRVMSLDRIVAEALALTVPAGAASVQPTNGEHPALGALSAREREIAQRVAQGKTNRQIASELAIAERTVDTHLENILKKLRVRSRALVAAWATKVGLQSPEHTSHAREVGTDAQKG